MPLWAVQSWADNCFDNRDESIPLSFYAGDCEIKYSVSLLCNMALVHCNYSNRNENRHQYLPYCYSIIVPIRGGLGFQSVWLPGLVICYSLCMCVRLVNLDQCLSYIWVHFMHCCYMLKISYLLFNKRRPVAIIWNTELHRYQRVDIILYLLLNDWWWWWHVISLCSTILGEGSMKHFLPVLFIFLNIF